MKSGFYKLILLSIILISFSFAQNAAKIPLPKIGVWVVSNYQYIDNDNLTPNNTFNLKHARFIVKGKLLKNIDYHAMVDLHDNAVKGAKFMQAWVGYTVTKALKFRVGQFKYPFGIEAYPSLMKWKFTNPSFITGSIVKKLGSSGNAFRDVGAQVFGAHKFSKSVSLEYKVMIMNGAGANKAENNNDKDIVVYAGLKLPKKIHLGASLYSGKGGPNGELSETAFGLQAKFNTKKLALQAEYITANFDKTTTTEVKPNGFYAYASYKILPKVELGLRIDRYKADTDANEMKRLTFATGYYFNPINRIMVNYEVKENMDNVFTLQFYLGI